MKSFFKYRSIYIVIIVIAWTFLFINYSCAELDPAQLISKKAITDIPFYTDDGHLYDYNEIHPQVATDGLGNWLVTYNGYYEDGIGCSDCSATAGNYSVYTLFSSDDGKTWTAPVCEKTLYTDVDQKVIEDGKGNWTLIWCSNNPDGAGSIINVTRITTNAWSLDPCYGGHWGKRDTIHYTDLNTTADDMKPDIATDQNGNWVVIWYSYYPLTPSEVYFSYSNDDIQTWSNEENLNNKNVIQSTSDKNPSICYSNGFWIVLWTSEGSPQLGSDGDILVSRSLNGHEWSDPYPIDAQAAYDDRVDSSPQIVADGLGNLLAVWVANYPKGNGTGKDNDIYYSQSEDNGVSWTVPSTVNSYANNDLANDKNCSISYGGDKWLVVWESDRIYNNKFPNSTNILLSSKSIKNSLWLHESLVYSNASESQGVDGEPCISANPNSKYDYLIVWSSTKNLFENGSDKDIMYIRTKDP